MIDLTNFNSNNNIIIKKSKKDKYLGGKKLTKDYNNFIGSKKYSIYHFSSSKKLMSDKTFLKNGRKFLH